MEENKGTLECEDSLEIGSKIWQRAVGATSKAGYREGVQDGSQSVYQEGFDKGYEAAFKTAFVLGQYKSFAFSIPQHNEYPSDIQSILEKTRRGACYLCHEQSKNKTIDKVSLLEIKCNQLRHSVEVIDKLHTYFDPIMKEIGIDINRFVADQKSESFL